MQYFKQIFPLRKHIDLLVVICNCLVENITLCAMVHTLHYLLLTVYNIVRLLFVNMAFEVVLVVRLPRLRTHITETFTTFACHEIAAH